MKVFVIIPEQTIAFTEIMPETRDLSPNTIRFPLVRIMENGLAKRLVKTVVVHAPAEM